MAKFKVLECVTEAVVMVKKKTRDEDDNIVFVEVEKKVKVEPSFYGVKCKKAGDVIEIKDQFLAGKARKNPMLEEVVEEKAA